MSVKFILSALSRLGLLVIISTYGNLTQLQANQQPTATIIFVAGIIYVLAGTYKDAVYD